MKIISNKRREAYALVVFLTGIGVSILTYFYIKENHGNAQWVNIYCIFNSFLTIGSGILLLYKKIKAYNIFALILGLSVLVGFFIPTDFISSYSLVRTISVELTVLGVYFGSIYGGFISVPLFLFNSFYGLYKVILSRKGRITYEL